MFIEASWERANGQAVTDAIEKAGYDVDVLAAGQERIVVVTYDDDFTPDTLQQLVWDLNGGAQCSVREPSEDELIERELI